MYKTETHVHTSDVSSCGRICASDIVKLYHEAGYKTIFITDHFDRYFLDSLGNISWEDKMTIFLSGYYRAKEAGKQYGMNVLFGIEISFEGEINHYLVYGITREFLNAYPDVDKLGIEKFSELAREHNLFIVQAHPNRDAVCKPRPQFVDAFEIYNSNPRHQDYSDRTEKCADENNLYKTAGSDAHQLPDVGKAGVLSETEIKSAEDYINLVKSGNLEIYKG